MKTFNVIIVIFISLAATSTLPILMFRLDFVGIMKNIFSVMDAPYSLPHILITPMVIGIMVITCYAWLMLCFKAIPSYILVDPKDNLPSMYVKLIKIF